MCEYSLTTSYASSSRAGALRYETKSKPGHWTESVHDDMKLNQTEAKFSLGNPTGVCPTLRAPWSWVVVFGHNPKGQT